MLKFHIIDDRAKTILGLPDAMKLQLLRLHPEVHEVKTKERPSNIPSEIWDEYSDVFRDTPGTLPVTYKMKLMADAVPVVRPPRRIPHGIVDQVKTSLDEMEKDGIITKVTEPTEWVSSMVAVKKKNTSELQDLY